MTVRPCGFDEHPAKMTVAGFGDSAATRLAPTRVLARHRTAVAHQLRRTIKARQLSHFGDESGGRQLRYATQRLQGVDDGAHRRGHLVDGLVNGALQAHDALALMVRLGGVVGERVFERALLELQLHDPVAMLVGPRPHPDGRRAPTTQQKLEQSLTRAPLVGLRRLACPNQISKRLVLGIRNPHRRQISRT